MIVGTSATNLVILLINFATSILAARLLGVDGRGQLALVLLYPQIITTMGLLGLDRGLAITGGQKCLNNPILSIVLLTLLFMMPVMLISYFVIISNVSDPLIMELSLLYTLYTPALYLFMLSGALFNGLGLFFEYNLSRLLFYGSYLLLIIAFWVIDFPSLEAFVYSSLLSVYVVMMASVIFMIRAKRRGMIKKGSWKVSHIVKDFVIIFRKASLFIIPGVLMVASSRLDQIIVSNYMDLKFLGLFVVYVAFSQLLGPITNAVNVNIFHIGITGSKRDIGRFVRSIIFIYMIGSILLALLAPLLINLLYGGPYLEYVNSARLLVFSAFFMFCSKAINEFMMGKSLVRQSVIVSVIFMVSLISFSYVLIPILSLAGMAVSMVGANALRFIYIAIAMQKSSGVGLGRLLVFNRRDFTRAVLSAKKSYKAWL